MKPLSAGDPLEVGPYRLLARLGSGGMGQVFLGRSRGGRTVAVKLVRSELAEDPQFKRRFAQEVEAARRVGGFYTAQVVDADPEADPPWMVTSYIPGPSLREAVARYGPMPAGTVTVLGAGLAEGLAAIHACALVHRDLKPGNVILAEDGPRVIDFGIARALDATSSLTNTTVIGTPAFMSPEQIRSRPITPASDVFSLAAVLAYAATGRGPFGDGPTEAIVYRVVHDEPDLTGLPAELAPLIEACFSKDPGRRPGVAEVLEHCAGQARPTTDWLPPDVTAMIAEQALKTGELSTAVVPHPPTLVDDQAPTEDRITHSPHPGTFPAKVKATVAGYSPVVLPWIPGETGGVKKTTVVRWLKQVGDTVAKNDPLLEVASPRGNIVITAPKKGTLYTIHRPAGKPARTGAVIAGIGTPTATIPRAPWPRPLRLALDAFGVLLALAFIAGLVSVASPLYEGDIAEARAGDCAHRWYPVHDGKVDPREKWHTMPCALMKVRKAFAEDERRFYPDAFFEVLARLDGTSSLPKGCADTGTGWSETNTRYSVETFDDMKLCLRKL
ncbi:protein kinase [Streptomyces sp. NPDC059874]|uniref:protein kinase domain-containing protein n=1 Tax=Streptomyces sp. NPDC059874 TaxID=3346983 RepID=UPI00366835D2